MENASKALMMAGSMLIALLVIGVAIYMFGQLSQAKKAEIDADTESQLYEYSRRLEQYNKTIYGSELLSLANLKEDYKVKGIENISITVNGTNIDELEAVDKMKALNRLDNVPVIINLKSKRLKELSQMNWIQIANYYELLNDGRTSYTEEAARNKIAGWSNDIIKDIQDQFDIRIDDIEIAGIKIENIIESISSRVNAATLIEYYRELQSDVKEFKNKRYKCINVEYNSNGIITSMEFE